LPIAQYCLIHNSLVLDRENTIQVWPLQWHKGRSFLSCRPRKFLIEFRDVGLLRKGVGPFQGRDLSEPQLLWESPLPSSKAAFTASPRLRRIRRGHSDSQFLRRSADLGQIASDPQGHLLSASERNAPLDHYRSRRTSLSFPPRAPVLPSLS